MKTVELIPICTISAIENVDEICVFVTIQIFPHTNNKLDFQVSVTVVDIIKPGINRVFLFFQRLNWCLTCRRARENFTVSH